MEGWRESLGGLVFSLSTTDPQRVTKIVEAIVKVENKRENRAPIKSNNILVTLELGTSEAALEATIQTKLSLVEGKLNHICSHQLRYCFSLGLLKTLS